jgi:hypothetical protein
MKKLLVLLVLVVTAAVGWSQVNLITGTHWVYGLDEEQKTYLVLGWHSGMLAWEAWVFFEPDKTEKERPFSDERAGEALILISTRQKKSVVDIVVELDEFYSHVENLRVPFWKAIWKVHGQDWFDGIK